MGRSWGTIIGILAAARYPELFYAYIGIGQFVDAVKGEKISYQFAIDNAQKFGHKKALKELKKIGPPPYDDYRKNLLKGKWIDEFGGVQYGHKDKYELIRKVKKALLSPEMSLGEILKIITNLYFSIDLLCQIQRQERCSEYGDVKINFGPKYAGWQWLRFPRHNVCIQNYEGYPK